MGIETADRDYYHCWIDRMPVDLLEFVAKTSIAVGVRCDPVYGDDFGAGMSGGA